MSEYKMLFGFATMDFNENIGVVVDETPEYFVIKKPLTLLKQQVSGDGSVGVSFVPFMLSVGAAKAENIKVYKSNIAWAISEPDIDEGLVNGYTTQTTGLVVAGTSQIPPVSKLLVK